MAVAPPRTRAPRKPPTGMRRTDKRRAVVPVNLTGVVPAHPLAADHLTGVAAWCGKTNLRFGTCGVCYLANSAIQVWQYLKGEAISVADQAVYDLYRRSGNPLFDPSTGDGDGGVDMTVMLAEAVKNGFTITHADGSTEVIKPLLFGAVDLSDYDNVHAVTAIAGGVGFGLDLDEAQAAQLQGGQPWDYAAGSPPWGGHAVLGGTYTSSSAPHTVDETIITWQKPQGTTAAFLGHQLSEAYLVVWGPLWEHPAFAAGVDQPALIADFEMATGRPWTGPAPLTPPPAPAPATALEQYLGDARLATWAGKRHTAENKYAAARWEWLRGSYPGGGG